MKRNGALKATLNGLRDGFLVVGGVYTAGLAMSGFALPLVAGVLAASLAGAAASHYGASSIQIDASPQEPEKTAAGIVPEQSSSALSEVAPATPSFGAAVRPENASEAAAVKPTDGPKAP